jgi:hypothetical protein
MPSKFYVGTQETLIIIDVVLCELLGAGSCVTYESLITNPKSILYDFIRLLD